MEVIKGYHNLLENLSKKYINTESSLYLYQNEVFKILDANLRCSRERIILESLKQKLKGIIQVNELLYENDYFVGYTMPFLKNLTIKSYLISLQL